MNANQRPWRAYTDLAWTEPIISRPDDYKNDTELFIKAIHDNSSIRVKTLLHLGCGAGVNDYTFKRHFRVTGVDISEEMLKLAKELNPGVDYIRGDMREVELSTRFDAVSIPDSIMHMTSETDLKKAINVASKHLNPGGVLLIVTHVSEEFRDNNFVYTGSRGDVEITIFENNCIVKPACKTWEATVIYLIRRKGRLEIHSDSCSGGLFPLSAWLNLLKDAGFEVKQTKIEHFYDRFIMEGGKYILRMFACRKLL